MNHKINLEYFARIKEKFLEFNGETYELGYYPTFDSCHMLLAQVCTESTNVAISCFAPEVLKLNDGKNSYSFVTTTGGCLYGRLDLSLFPNDDVEEVTLSCIPQNDSDVVIELETIKREKNDKNRFVKFNTLASPFTYCRFIYTVKFRSVADFVPKRTIWLERIILPAKESCYLSKVCNE